MDKVIYCWWTGENEMSEQRKKSLEQIEKVSKCKVIFLTKDNISNYILPEHPLHPGYKYLSATQKGDYLKAYFMNFYGGGYTDIKLQTDSWINSFDILENSDKWVIGYPELDAGCIGYKPAQHLWQKLVGNGAYICKPHTPITEEWYTEMMKLMDEKFDKLKEFPAEHTRDCAEKSNGKYPIEWCELNGKIFHKVCSKYTDKIINTFHRIICYNYM